MIGVIIGTGPSLTVEQISKVRHLPLYGANRAFEFDIDVVLGCNLKFWAKYWDDIKDLRCDKWCSHDDIELERYPGLKHIKGLWEPGISIDRNFIHAHHGSGPQIFNLAYHYGVRTFILIGWDMRFPGKINDRFYEGKRHYFGEDDCTKSHWPKTGPSGELTGLINEMKTIVPEDYGIEVINCTPDSAMRCFKRMDLDEALCTLAS